LLEPLPVQPGARVHVPPVQRRIFCDRDARQVKKISLLCEQNQEAGMRGFLALAVGLSLALRMGLATQTSNPGNPAPPAMEIIRNTSGAPGVFSAQPDGSVIHIQSGFVCPASFPNA